MGFRLSSLPKFLQTKSNTGVSLIDYVVNHLMNQEPELLSVISDFHDMEDAKKIAFSSLNAETAKISVGISLANKILEDPLTSENPLLKEKLEENLKIVSETSKLCEMQCETAVQSFNRICAFLGEPVSDPETLFGQLQAFLQTFDKSIKDVQAKQKKKPIAQSLKNIF
jgi:hypothetical protein